MIWSSIEIYYLLKEFKEIIIQIVVENVQANYFSKIAFLDKFSFSSCDG